MKKNYLMLLLALVTFLWLSKAALAKSDMPEIVVSPPPFSEGIFPCSDCHADLEANTTRRELSNHEDIKLEHFDGWCFDCHNPTDRDKLRLASGKLIPFSESYYLCGQCHGDKFRDWKAGVHGKRTGFWNGKKEYRLCVHCHWPHSPQFKSLQPLPPPLRPEDNKYRNITQENIPLNPINNISDKLR